MAITDLYGVAQTMGVSITALSRVENIDIDEILKMLKNKPNDILDGIADGIVGKHKDKIAICDARNIGKVLGGCLVVVCKKLNLNIMQVYTELDTKYALFLSGLIDGAKTHNDEDFIKILHQHGYIIQSVIKPYIDD